MRFIDALQIVVRPVRMRYSFEIAIIGSPFKHGLKEGSCHSALGNQSSWFLRQWANAWFATGRTISVPACFAALLDMLS
jgi:hypothetical protein